MMKNKSNTKRILKILLIFFAIGMLCTGGMLIYYWTRYSSDRNANEAVKRLAYQASDDDMNNSLNSGENGNTGDNKASFSTKSINFGALSEMNPEIIGWISACGELIDGPVVQTDNNDYYLSHIFDNSEVKARCFFADTY
jgi:sortase B